MLLKTSIFKTKDKIFHYFEKVKLSTLEQIETLAASCGFEAQKIWGNYNLEDLR